VSVLGLGVLQRCEFAKVKKVSVILKSGALWIVVSGVGGLKFCREKGENAFLVAKLGVLYWGRFTFYWYCRVAGKIVVQ